MIEARPRIRPAPAPVSQTPLGYPVIGGPRAPEKLPQNAVFPVGTYHCLEGRPINVWPWHTGKDIIGLVYHEYTTDKKGEHTFITTHIYRLVDKTWRYAGKVASWADARTKLDDLYEKANTKEPVVQRVAPRARVRRAV